MWLSIQTSAKRSEGAIHVSYHYHCYVTDTVILIKRLRRAMVILPTHWHSPGEGGQSLMGKVFFQGLSTGKI